MLEHTKKHPTDSVQICLTGPAANRERAIRAMKRLGFTDTSDSMPWRDAFPELEQGSEAGNALRGARHRAELTQARLAELAGIPQRHISEMENAKRSIGKKNAAKLAEILHLDKRLLLG